MQPTPQAEAATLPVAEASPSATDAVAPEAEANPLAAPEVKVEAKAEQPARPKRAYNDPREVKRREREAKLRAEGILPPSSQS